jgi:excisionase family DNA binding protein
MTRTPAPPRRYLTVPQCCEALGVSRSTVLRLVASGKLECIRPGGPTGHRRITAASVRRHKSESAVGPDVAVLVLPPGQDLLRDGW